MPSTNTTPPESTPTAATPALAIGDRVVGGWRITEAVATRGAHQRYLALDEHGRAGIVDLLCGVARRRRLLEGFVEDVESWGDAAGDHLARVVAAGRGLEPSDAVRVVKQPMGTPLSHLSLPVDPMMASQIARDVTRALAAAHARGLVHGDVKASRVWVERGRARLEPGGLRDALMAAEVEVPVVGSWCAPELLEGAFDRPADIYGVGVILCELVTGRAPEVASDGRRGPPSVMPLPEPLVRLLEAVLHVDPQQRPTATELLGMLVDMAPEALGPGLGERMPTASIEPRTVEPRLVDEAHMDQRPTLPQGGRRSRVPADAREHSAPELGAHETHIPDMALMAAGAVVGGLALLLGWLLLQ